MTGLELYSHSLLDDQLWYVAHPVRPTDADVAAFRAREDELDELGRETSGLVTSFPVRMRRRTDREIHVQIIQDNIVNAKAWLAWLVRAFPTITFIAPWIAALDGGGDDDLDPAMRARGLRDCCRTIRVCSGIVLVGGRVSGGMSDEKSHARAVVDLTFLGRVPPTIEVKS